MSRRRTRPSGGIAGAALTLPQMAARVASAGTGGDNSRSGGMIAHINAHEAAMLKAAGGSGDINPRTGLRQFYDTGGGSDSAMGNDMGTSGGAAGSAAGGQGGLGGGGIGADSGGGFTHDPSLGSGVTNNGMAERSKADDDAVGQLSVTPGTVSGVNAASSTMQGLAPSFSDDVKDFLGINNPGGFFGSNAAVSAAGVIGSLVAGPFGAMAAKGLTGAAQGRGLEGSLNSAVSGLGTGIQSAIDHGTSGPVGNDGTNTAGGSSAVPTDGIASQADITKAAQILATPGQNTDAQRLQALYAMGGSLSPAQIGALMGPPAAVGQPAVGIMGYASGGQIAHKFASGSGLFPGSAPGRADTITTQLPPGGHVVPADVVSGIGQGNTASGAASLKRMIASAPRSPARLANGGSVPVKVSSGEFYIHPSHVAALGGGNLDAGHAKLRQMSAAVRQGAVRHAQTVAAPR